MNIREQVNTQKQGVLLAKYGLGKGASHAWIWDSMNDRWDVSKLGYEAVSLIRAAESFPADDRKRKGRKPAFTDFDPTTESHSKGFFPAYTVAELGELLPPNRDFPYKEHDGSWTQNDSGCFFFTEAEARAELLIRLLKKGVANIVLDNISV